MTKSPKPNKRQQLDPVPQGLIQLYGLIAILIVIIPEKLAELVIAIISSSSKDQLPPTAQKWNTHPDLLLASMNLRELRNFAKRLKVHGYSGDNRANLYKRLLERLSKQIKMN